MWHSSDNRISQFYPIPFCDADIEMIKQSIVHNIFLGY